MVALHLAFVFLLIPRLKTRTLHLPGGYRATELYLSPWTLFLVFWRTSVLFSIMMVLIHITTRSVLGSPFSTPNHHVDLVVWQWPSWEVCGGNLIAVLVCISLMTRGVEHFFLYLFALTFFFEKCPLCPFLNYYSFFIELYFTRILDINIRDTISIWSTLKLCLLSHYSVWESW